MKIYVADKEAGNFITNHKSIEEAKQWIEFFEKEDKQHGCYEENFYDIVNEYHESLL